MEMDRKSPFEIAKETLEARRENALLEANKKTEEFHRLVPESIKIDNLLSTTAVRLFQIAMEHDHVQEKIAKLKEENEALQKQRETLLKTANLPLDFTDVHYVCNKCSDSGYISIRMCSCMKSIIQMEELKNSGLGALLQTQSFDTFSLSYYDKSSLMSKNLEICKNFANTFEPGKENLLFIGGTGLGKTHLSTSIAQVVVQRGYSVVYESISNCMNAFEFDKFNNSYNKEPSKSEKYKVVPLLILDDLGTEFSTQFTYSCLYQIINERSVRGLSTIISTNLSIQELMDRYDQRLISRLLGTYTILQFEGEDIRLQKLRK